MFAKRELMYVCECVYVRRILFTIHPHAHTHRQARGRDEFRAKRDTISATHNGSSQRNGLRAGRRRKWE